MLIVANKQKTGNIINVNTRTFAHGKVPFTVAFNRYLRLQSPAILFMYASISPKIIKLIRVAVSRA